MMTRVDIDPKWTGNSIRMASCSRALDDSVEPVYIMQTFEMRNAFYIGSCCRLVHGCTFAAGNG